MRVTRSWFGLEVSAIYQILDRIVNSRQSGTESILSFHWQANHVDDFFEQLDARLLHMQALLKRRMKQLCPDIWLLRKICLIMLNSLVVCEHAGGPLTRLTGWSQCLSDWL